MNKKEYQARYYRDNRERIIIQRKEWYKKNLSLCSARHNEYNHSFRLKVLTHYGNGQLKCVQCGFSDERALSIDHINGGGNQHRKQSGCGTGIRLYFWLRKEGYPEGYQTLCMNCQFMKKVDEG